MSEGNLMKKFEREIEQKSQELHKVVTARFTTDRLKNTNKLKIKNAKTGVISYIDPQNDIYICEKAISILKSKIMPFLTSNVEHIVWNIEDDICPTAFSDGRLIAFNVQFADVLLDMSVRNFHNEEDFLVLGKYVLFTVVHEFYHQMFRHHYRSKLMVEKGIFENLQKMFNIAMDLEINREIENHYTDLFGGSCKEAGLLWFETFIQEMHLNDQESQVLRYGLWEDIFEVLHNHKDDPYLKSVMKENTRKPPKGGDPGKSNKQEKYFWSPEARKAYEEAYARKMRELKGEEGNVSESFINMRLKSNKRRMEILLKRMNEDYNFNEEIDDNFIDDPYKDYHHVTVDEAIAAAEADAIDDFYKTPIKGGKGKKPIHVNGPQVNRPQRPIEGGGDGGDGDDEDDNDDNGGNGGNGDDDDDDGTPTVISDWETDDDEVAPRDVLPEDDARRQMDDLLERTGESDSELESHSVDDWQNQVSKQAENYAKNNNVGGDPKQGFGQSLADYMKKMNQRLDFNDIGNWKEKLRPFFRAHGGSKKQFIMPNAFRDLMDTDIEGKNFIPSKEEKIPIVNGILDIVFIVDNSGSMQFNYTDPEGQVRPVFDRIIAEVLALESQTNVKHSALLYFADGEPGKIRYWDKRDLSQKDKLAEELARQNDSTGGTSLVHSLSFLFGIKNKWNRPIIDGKTVLVIMSDGGDDYKLLPETMKRFDSNINQCVYLLYGTNNKSISELMGMVYDETGMNKRNIIGINVSKEYGAVAREKPNKKK